MRHRTRKQIAALGGAASLLVSAAQLLAVQANGVIVEPRFFNDFSASSQTISINNGPAISTPTNATLSVSGLPASVHVVDSNLANAGGGGFANRDDVLISTDGGGTAWNGNINNGFSISATFTLNDGTNAPRKETGLRINAPVTGDALFIVDSDAGEIVAFGGGAPFFNFRPGIEAAFTPGQTITLGETYTPGPGGTTGANPGFITYTAQLAGGPLISSGPLAFSNLEGGPGGAGLFNIGAYEQSQSSGAADFIDDNISNITASVSVPEPTSLGLLAAGGVAMLARRRGKKA